MGDNTTESTTTPVVPADSTSSLKMILTMAGIGFMAGIGGGLLGWGGGNLLVAVLVFIGLGPKKASATTAFIVIFLSFAGFLGHASTGLAGWDLTAVTALGAALGAMVGAWLLDEKLDSGQVKRIVGAVLIFIAAKVVFDLLVK